MRFHQARVSIERIGDILNAVSELVYAPGSASLLSIHGAIAFDHVTFRYRLDAPPVLQDICLVLLSHEPRRVRS